MNLLNARTFAQVNGAATLALGLVGMILNGKTLLGIEFDMAHNVVHLLIAVVSLYVGFGNVSDAVTSVFAKTFGAVYLLLGVVGFFAPVTGMLHALLGLHLEVLENVLHLALGVWGLAAGFKND